MFAIEKPLPLANEDSQEYWEACKRGELRLQKCAGCAHVRFPPAALCPRCLSESFAWEPMSGRGKVYTWIVVHRTLRLLEVASGARVLDVACGQGVLCRALAQAGARVTGIDAAPALIEAARRRNRSDRLAIDYRVGDARKLDVETATFDAAVCILAIQNIAPLSPLWEGCRHALVPGGKPIVVLMHP